MGRRRALSVALQSRTLRDITRQYPEIAAIALELEGREAMLDGEATVKTFRRRDGHTWLLPRNSAFEPILGDEAEILGKVVAVLRSL